MVTQPSTRVYDWAIIRPVRSRGGDVYRRNFAGTPLTLLTGRKSAFSPRRGDSLHGLTWNLAQPRGMLVRLAVQNFTPISARCKNVLLPPCKVWGRSNNARRLWCEKMVFVCFTGRTPQIKRRQPVFKFTHRPKISISGPRTDWCEIWHSRGARDPLGCAKFHANRYPGVGTRPPKWPEFPLFGKESPHRGEPFDRFLQLLGAFISPTLLH